MPITKKIKRKEITKDYVISIRFNDDDIKEYERKAIEMQISLAELIRQTLKKSISKKKQ